MKNLTAMLLALSMVGCGHATTKMDRELALKLVDKAGRIEIVRTNNGSAPQQYATPADQQADENELAQLEQEKLANTDTRSNCINSPVYTVRGAFSHYVKQCFGGK